MSLCPDWEPRHCSIWMQQLKWTVLWFVVIKPNKYLKRSHLFMKIIDWNISKIHIHTRNQVYRNVFVSAGQCPMFFWILLHLIFCDFWYFGSLLAGVLKTKLMSSCFRSKPFTNWAIPIPQISFFRFWFSWSSWQ